MFMNKSVTRLFCSVFTPAPFARDMSTQDGLKSCDSVDIPKRTHIMEHTLHVTRCPGKRIFFESHFIKKDLVILCKMTAHSDVHGGCTIPSPPIFPRKLEYRQGSKNSAFRVFIQNFIDMINIHVRKPAVVFVKGGVIPRVPMIKVYGLPSILYHNGSIIVLDILAFYRQNSPSQYFILDHLSATPPPLLDIHSGFLGRGGALRTR